MGILRGDMSVKDAVNRINDAILNMDYGDVVDVVKVQGEMAIEQKFKRVRFAHAYLLDQLHRFVVP